ncbi:acyl-CoA desaturase-like [Leptopilina heterotoma]|uniref:acyl-CoA desaturase-like n=1 Tax=Leptopilina heterotoma TaxID=63436 RepID=UPI001CA7C710|nr:acyl-CoA desaturase-like [Leptopilina heterotoma]
MIREDKILKVTKNGTNAKFLFANEWNIWIKHLNWSFVIFHVIIHIVAINGIFTFPYLTHKLTALWILINYFLTGFGISGGAHRYWSHRSYKAKFITSKNIFSYLLLWQWHVHRMHHKYSDTDADPHNINRGFWFAHIGWFLLPKHPEFMKKLNEIDMSDINADSVVTFWR